MLIPGKSHSRDKSRNSRVSIETLDFARVHILLPAWSELDHRRGREGGGAITDRTRRCSWSMTGPHCRLRMIDIAGGGTPKTAGGGYRGVRPGSFAGLTKSYKSEIFVHLHTGFFTGWMSLLSPRHQWLTGNVLNVAYWNKCDSLYFKILFNTILGVDCSLLLIVLLFCPLNN